MLKLEDIKKDAQVRGIQGDEVVRVVQTEPVGDHALTVYYKDSQGRLNEQMLFRTDEARLELAQAGRPWAFDAPGADFKLGLEAYRITQAAMFDPMMAVHTSNVEPLPHQISAVYEHMLPRQPLRYVLADDPGAGKTIMAGLLIRELLMRADAKRILIVSPGGLTDQWQDEMLEKFSVQFQIFSREKQEQCASGNYFNEVDLLICRLDQLSRNEDLQEKLKNSEWDLIIVDEAHKLSANYFGNKVNKTKRFQLGELLGTITRHFLLMTATPHNGKEEDFQIWLSLLDGDRFYGKFREGAHKVDISDMMRRMVKEELLKFDGTPLFPERLAYSANYQLSDAEADLYAQVTDYVRNEMNRADNLDGKRRGTVGFALTQLQRRLASSPEAIYQSIKRRRKRLESRLDEMKLVARGHAVAQAGKNSVAETLGEYQLNKELDIPDNIDELDDDELSAEEYERFAEQVVDQATAAETIPELEAEIQILKDLEYQAMTVVQSGNDKKWEELSHLLQDRPEMYTAGGSRRKLIIFTEHKDTLNYLMQRIRGLLGNPEAVLTIHGGTSRDARRKAQEEFRNNPDVLVLVATDAAGEGVNLQNASLMVNYDLPWNPNRLEQRFGRIHRIGQTEVCHLWNLIANETREGAVFQKLFEKLEIEKKALGGKVFDVLGEAFENRSLKDLLVEAIRYGESPEVKARLNQVIDGALDTAHLREILKRNALVEQHMSLEDLYAVKEEMEKAEARKLQPYFIRAFFTEAFRTLSGEMRQRESGRYEVRHVPAAIRERDRVMGESRTPVLKKYERVCFEKQLIRSPGKPMADLIHPNHPLMAATTDLVLSAHRSKLKQGAVLVNPNDEGIEPRILFMVDHSIREGESAGTAEKPAIASRRLQFVEIDQQGNTSHAGWAPHLDLQPIDSDDRKLIQDVLNAPWITGNLEAVALNHASQHLVPEHYREIKTRRELQSEKIHAAVHERLVKEINYLSGQAIKLDQDVAAGKQPRMQPENFRRRAEELTARLEQRKRELEAMKNVVSSTPVVIGGALVIPQGLLDMRKGKPLFTVDARARAHIEQVAMQAVTDHEEALGHTVKDVSAEKCGWDITSRPKANPDGSLPQDRHIEVKGRAKGHDVITVSRNEILYALNQEDKFWLAIVLVDGNSFEGPYYVQNPFTIEPDFGVPSVNYELKHLLSKAVPPGAKLMNLETLKVTNFRRFEHLEVSFHPELTILAARNGQGKTSILDAAAIALGTFVGAFDLGTAKHIAQADARYQRLPGHSDSEQVFPVRLEATLKSMDKPVIRELLGAKGRTTIKHASALTGLGKILMKQVQALESVPLPLLAYYGSGRLWNAHKNMSRKSVLSESRTLGYEDCFSSASSFTQVQQWMTKATFAALQQQSMEVYQGHKIADQIKGIQNTVDTVLSSDGWSGFHYSVQHEELAMTHEELGVLPVSMLSDGVRAMVSLVADMAWRCAKLNPQMGADASKKTAGIAFIDEVDMHLHPKWQQTVIGSLRSAFPNVQFIVTTHSPQVLSTVKSESIRLVRSELDRETGKFISQAVIPTMQSRGVASNDVMAELQGTDAVPNVEEAKWLQDYKALVTSNQLTPEQANRKQALMTNIIAHFGDDHPEWLECQRIERLQAMKAKLAGKLSAGKSRD